MKAPRLLGITPAEYSPEALASLLPGLSDSLDALLLRWPGLSARSQFEFARTLARVSPRPLLLLSDRLDIARSAGLDGVHLKENSLPPSHILTELRPALLGASRHDRAGVSASRDCDYLTLSPLNPTRSKPGVLPLGRDELGRLVRGSAIPVLALGGVRVEDVAPVLALGAHGVAVSAGIFEDADPLAAAARYAEALRVVGRA